MNTRFATRIALLVLSLVVLVAWQQGTRRTTWEYMCSDFPSSRIGDRINEAGRGGWEMVGFESEGNLTKFCFKRAR